MISPESLADQLDALSRQVASLQGKFASQEQAALEAALSPADVLRVGSFPSGADVYPAGTTTPGFENIIADGAITADTIAANAVTAGKLSVGNGLGLAGITNPGFETGDLTGWETYNPSANGSASVEEITGSSLAIGTGKYQARIACTGAGAGPYLISNDYLPCLTGDYVLMSALVKGTGSAGFRAFWYSDAKAYLSDSGATVSVAGGRVSAVIGAAPASARFCRVALYEASAAANATCFDDIRVQVGDAAVISATGNVVIDNAGVAIFNGKLTVKNAAATVIIDGTSEMFLIASTGTLSVSGVDGSGAAGAEGSTYTAVATGLTYTPVTMWSQTVASGTTGPGYRISWDRSNGYASSGLTYDEFHHSAAVVSTDQTGVQALWATRQNRTGSTRTFRYTILRRAAL